MKHQAVIYFLIIFLLSGCSGAGHRLLKQADAIMEEHPDSALALLTPIDYESLSKRELPYYALLMTQAMVKTDVPVDSDSLISIAFKTYSDDWWGDKGIRSYFYMGEVFFNQDKTRDAMRLYLSAYEEAKRLDNDYWHAKAAERIADLFFNAYNYGESAKYRKEAIKYFGKANKIRNQRFAVADLTSDLINDSKIEEAKTLFDDVYGLNLKEYSHDSILLDYYKRKRIDILLALGRHHELYNTDLTVLEKNQNKEVLLDNNLIKLALHRQLNQKETTSELFYALNNSAKTDEEKALVFYALYKDAKSRDDIKSISSFLDSIVLYQNIVTEKIIKESVTGAERDFYSNQYIRHKKNSTTYLFGLVTVIFLILIISIFLWRLHCIRNTARNAELEGTIDSLLRLKSYADKVDFEKSTLISEINDTKSELSNLKQRFDFFIHETNLLKQEADENLREFDRIKRVHLSEITYRNRIVARLFKEKWKTLNMLCEEYFIMGSSQKVRERILKKIEIEIKNISTNDGLHQIEEEADKYLNGIAGSFRKDHPFMKEKELVFVYLIFAGFSVKAICYILGITTNYYYVKKKRIIQKIEQNNSPKTRDYIDLLKGSI